MEKQVSTILFDLGGVILNLDYQKTINAFKVLGEDRFEEKYAQAQQSEVFDAIETGAISPAEFRNHLRTIVGNEVKDAILDDAWNAMLLDLPKERIDLLLALKGKYRILLFSNTNAIHLQKFQEIIAAQYGEKNLLESIFHKTYYSHLIGLRKPNKAAFQYILDEQQLHPSEVVFIDDSEQHIKGAASLGIEAIHLLNTDIHAICSRFL